MDRKDSDKRLEGIVYIQSQLHISHCLTRPSPRHMKMGEFCSNG
jgi:hypothetical protein